MDFPKEELTGSKPMPIFKIIINKAQCRLCGDILVSEHVHDFKFCSCGELAVNGGKAYLKRSFKTSPANFIELSETIEVIE